ncbi:hypothetical protein [Okeania sp. SIO2C9]|nr:hypothetical protein [Okeania sp. SIO2C9]
MVRLNFGYGWAIADYLFSYGFNQVKGRKQQIFGNIVKGYY